MRTFALDKIVVIAASPPHSTTSISDDCPMIVFPASKSTPTTFFMVKVESFATTGAAVRRGLIALAVSTATSL